MSGFGNSLIGFLLAIAILVAVHEFGHFWVARRFGVKVLKFSIGFGRSLWTWRRANDPTEYTVAWIPLGGYVRMLDEREGNVFPQERHLAFNNQSLGVRTAVVLAGPLFNFLFAILAIWLVFQVGSPDIRPVVGSVVEDSLAHRAGFQVGDTLHRINGRPVKTWSAQQFYMLHQAMKGNALSVQVEGRDGIQRSLTLDFSPLDQKAISTAPITAQVGLYPEPPPAAVHRLAPGAPAEQSGLQPGDRILAVEGEAVANWVELVQAISARPDRETEIMFLRDGEQRRIHLIPAPMVVEGKTYGRIGLYRPPVENTRLRYGPVQAVWEAVDYNWRMMTVTLRSLGRMLTREMSSENLSGPITIARMAGATVESGLVDFLQFLAIISVSLGLLNLLPIPMLDGGHLLYYLIEAITGREPSEAVMIRGQQIGLVLLVGLMGIAFYNDFMRLFGLI